ncbi:MAG: glutamate--tRNA ligase [Candidatus Aenigmatarchaeota archaeon]
MQDTIKKHALVNAVEFDGKASVQSVMGKVLGEKPDLKSDMAGLGRETARIVKEVNSWPLDKQKQELEKFGDIKKPEKVEREGLPPLPNAEKGKVVLRLAPFPSGALHLGNAKTYMLNAIYAEMYEGKVILVMDDTIGSENKLIVPEAYDLIQDGFRWLGVKWDGPIVYKSDRLELYYKYSKELISKGSAYVCECSSENLRENRAKGLDCQHRKRTIEENAKLFDDMLSGKFKEGQAILRLKTSMQHPNPAFRDRVLCRISERSHPRVGKKYTVWPMLELSWAVDDYLLGVTHVIRGKELMIESDMCKFIWNILGWKSPTLIHSGLLQIEGIKLSKSKAQKEIKSGEYSGWDDPRTWSIQSMRRRGILPLAIRNFIISLGIAEHEMIVPIERLYNENKKLIDSTSNRYFFVSNPVEIKLDKVPIDIVKAPLFPGKEEYRSIPVTNRIFISKEDFEKNVGKEVRLMHFSNIILNKEATVTGKDLKDVPKIHWVSTDNIKAKIIMPDAQEIEGLAEPEVANVRADQVVQFERMGFARCDSKGLFYFSHK